MEAAGIMNSLPCCIIHDICDYRRTSYSRLYKSRPLVCLWTGLQIQLKEDSLYAFINWNLNHGQKHSTKGGSYGSRSLKKHI
ncbi:hypothetical protein BJY00DRAFT_286137 [Aspergillus carlsbadensis]|nr:hypothetical protein BJY00DRAFT_286137 [Aspergillus carlsbadensis]